VSNDHTLRVWSSDGSGQPLVISGAKRSGFGVAFSPDGRRIASGSSDNEVLVWNSDGTGDPLVLTGHLGLAVTVAFSPDGRSIASGSIDNTVRVWRDLEPVTVDDRRLWKATSYCLSVELRKQLLGVSDETARALHLRCLTRVAAAWK
jgi:WD40 repeat protein